MNQSFMKEKPILPLVLSMSFPMVLSMLVNALYNIIDSYFVAKVSEEAMTALSLVFPMQNIVNAVGVGTGIGINAVTAFYLGARNKEAADKTVSQGILMNIIHGILLTVLCTMGIRGFLTLFTADQEVISCGLQYGKRVFLFSTVLTVGVTFEKIFQAVGRMKVSMLCMMSGCVVNIVLDPVLIFGAGAIPAMGVKGAAWATGIGQLVSLILYLIIFLVQPMPVQVRMNRRMLCGKGYGKIYGVGIPATLNMALPSLLITALNGILAGFSQVYVLILGIYYKLQTFIYLTANGIVQGIRPLVGFNYGAGRKDRVNSIFKTALALGAGIMAVGMLLCMAVPQQLIGLFTENGQTIQQGTTALRIISCGFVVSAVSVMVSGTFEGLGKGGHSLLISLIRYILIIPVAFFLSRWAGAAGVWNAFWVTECIAAAAATGLYKSSSQ